MNTSIDKLIFGYHIANHQVAWQERGGVMCVSHGVSDPSYDEISALWDSMPSQLRVQSRDEMIHTDFSILAAWSRQDDDVLISGGDDLLLCIPKFAFDKLVECEV